MNEVAVTEFPFVEDLPKREKSKLQKLWDQLHDAKALLDKNGILIPQAIAGELGGVSGQRIDQLCGAGILERVYFAGRPFVTENSLVSWVKSERVSGRHLIVKSPIAVLKMGLAEGKRVYGAARQAQKKS